MADGKDDSDDFDLEENGVWKKICARCLEVKPCLFLVDPVIDETLIPRKEWLCGPCFRKAMEFTS